MTSATEPFKINLNQNLWGLIVGLGSLGFAEHFHHRTLFWFSIFISGVMSISTSVTTFAYTVNYWKNKQEKQ